MVCDHLGFCPYCSAEHERLAKVVQLAYAILAPVAHQWEGRHTAEGQEALAVMRDTIAKATGRNAEEVQDEFSA